MVDEATAARDEAREELATVRGQLSTAEELHRVALADAEQRHGEVVETMREDHATELEAVRSAAEADAERRVAAAVSAANGDAFDVRLLRRGILAALHHHSPVTIDEIVEALRQ
jgi:F0F1-type ATP synthase membrane subunit b/b'